MAPREGEPVPPPGVPPDGSLHLLVRRHSCPTAASLHRTQQPTAIRARYAIPPRPQCRLPPRAGNRPPQVRRNPHRRRLPSPPRPRPLMPRSPPPRRPPRLRPRLPRPLGLRPLMPLGPRPPSPPRPRPRLARPPRLRLPSTARLRRRPLSTTRDRPPHMRDRLRQVRGRPPQV